LTPLLDKFAKAAKENQTREKNAFASRKSIAHI
jgi:hypothetical protein